VAVAAPRRRGGPASGATCVSWCMGSLGVQAIQGARLYFSGAVRDRSRTATLMCALFG